MADFVSRFRVESNRPLPGPDNHHEVVIRSGRVRYRFTFAQENLAPYNSGGLVERRVGDGPWESSRARPRYADHAFAKKAANDARARLGLQAEPTEEEHAEIQRAEGLGPMSLAPGGPVSRDASGPGEASSSDS